MNVLITGGLGFIASHTACVLAEAGHQLVLLDNLVNSKRSVLQRLETIIGKPLIFIEGDVRDEACLNALFKTHAIDTVIHFAGLKSVSESSQDPLRYYSNNVGGSITLLQSMKAHGVKKFIFSSSATVYGTPQYLPYDESHPTNPINPYGQTKLQVEEIMRDLAHSDPSWSMIALRYFNPVGAHDSGLIGEDPSGIPNNLTPYLAQVASGQLPFIRVFGNDYETKDGTGERDYIHVMDLAEGHLAALHYVESHTGYCPVNLGTGVAYSVYEVIASFEKAIGRAIERKIEARRAGDLPVYYADPKNANTVLGWAAKRNLDQMCASAWNFQKTSVVPHQPKNKS